MANDLQIITATKIDGTTNNYVGTYGSDGYIYFNDADFYRFKPEGTWEDNAYILNRTRHSWSKTNIFTKLSKKNNDSGGGSIAADEGVEGAVQWAIDIANDDSHGYDQITRDGGVDYDCSSLVSTAFRNAGFNVPLPSPSTYTMRSAFEPLGFVWHPGNPSQSELQRGDIVLSINSHVEIYIGGGQLVGAHINEFGGIYYGQPGDQTGNEISVGGYYSFPWDGYLRYEG